MKEIREQVRRMSWRRVFFHHVVEQESQSGWGRGSKGRVEGDGVRDTDGRQSLIGCGEDL